MFGSDSLFWERKTNWPPKERSFPSLPKAVHPLEKEGKTLKKLELLKTNKEIYKKSKDKNIRLGEVELLTHKLSRPPFDPGLSQAQNRVCPGDKLGFRFFGPEKKTINNKTHKQNYHGTVVGLSAGGLSRDCPGIFLRFFGKFVYVFPFSPMERANTKAN